jgi:hypothetical protein
MPCREIRGQGPSDWRRPDLAPAGAERADRGTPRSRISGALGSFRRSGGSFAQNGVGTLSDPSDALVALPTGTSSTSSGKASLGAAASAVPDVPSLREDTIVREKVFVPQSRS